MHNFGRKLNITEDMGLDKFCNPTVSIIVNDNLNPHIDHLNSKNMKDMYPWGIFDELISILYKIQ